jgi:hypothetical protein
METISRSETVEAQRSFALAAINVSARQPKYCEQYCFKEWKADNNFRRHEAIIRRRRARIK